MRYASTIAAVLCAYAALSLLVGWLVWRSKPNPLYVFSAVNTTLLTCLLITIDCFRSEGLSLYSLFYAAAMFWLASRAAELGTIGAETAARRRRNMEILEERREVG